MYLTYLSSIPLSGIIDQIISNNWSIKKEGIDSHWSYLDNRIIPRPGVAGLSHTTGATFCS